MNTPNYRDEIDELAEREGKALGKQGKCQTSSQYKRIRQQTDHNKAEFDKLFKK